MLIYGVQGGRIVRSAIVSFLIADGAARFTDVLSTQRIFFATILALLSFFLWLDIERWIQKKRHKDL